MEYAGADRILINDLCHMRQIEEKEKPGEAWQFARMAGHRISALKNERIIQILDEFQYLNTYIYTDETYEKKDGTGGILLNVIRLSWDKMEMKSILSTEC